MPAIFLHDHKDFPDLLRIVGEEKGIDPYLIEKDYWLMHVLYGLQQQHYDFRLKGGTSLSKGYQIIQRFSEDIDIYIKPSSKLAINETSNTEKNVEKRKIYYDELAKEINIPGIIDVKRDNAFDDNRYYRSGGIRLLYKSHTEALSGVKEGILLEVGFDTVVPENYLMISSWAYDKANQSKALQLIDNRAQDISCYHPGYTFVEKLQTIATKYRRERETGIDNQNFMRQYYDIFCLLQNKEVQEFIGTEEYWQHKEKRFPNKDFNIPLYQNEAFLLSDPVIRRTFIDRYKKTAALYYAEQPSFEQILESIKTHLSNL